MNNKLYTFSLSILIFFQGESIADHLVPKKAEIRPGGNLQHTNLKFYDLSNTNLERANLSRTDLTGANLFNANLKNAYLILSNLSGANLSGANLEGTDFGRADLSGSNLSNAFLFNASLDQANIRGSNLDNIFADTYGAKTPLNQLGNISVLDASTITIQVWDSSVIKQIETAITESNLGINPQTDGQLIRLPIPK